MIAAPTASSLLGIGIYTASEAATYARVPTAKLTRWVLGTSRSRPAIRAQLSPESNAERWITFLDFVQSLAIRDIRIAFPRLHLDKIRETIEMAKSKFGIDYPFARKHTTFLRGDDLVLDIEKIGIVESTGPHKSQLNMRKVVERYLVDLSYDAAGLANGYVPLTWKGYDIVFDPRFHFGEPFVRRARKSNVKPCRYSVMSLCEAFDAEGSYAAASRSLGVSAEAVEAAHKYYFDYLRTSEAA